jgi:putative endonuclease
VGEVKVFAARRRPFDLVFVWEFETVPEAAIAERQIKGWTHAKKLALVRGDIELLHELAQCRNASHARHASIKAQ